MTLFATQQISKPPDGADLDAAVRLAETNPQPRDVGLHGIRLDVVLEAIGGGFKRLAQDNPACAPNHGLKNRELAPRDDDRALVHADDSANDVVAQIGD